MHTTQPDPGVIGMRSDTQVTTAAVGPDSALSTAQAAQRLAADGPNVLLGGHRRSLLSIADPFGSEADLEAVKPRCSC